MCYNTVMNEVIKQKIKELPSVSGVYLMLNAKGEVIYVGKAVNLKNRVSQYFHSSGNKTEKTIALVKNIVDFRYIITNNEVEALVLENNLIKQYTPKYNILLKDDKNYPFIKIQLKDDFPTIEVTRKLKEDGAKYFGPYMQGIGIRDITELIYSAFPLRACNLDLNKLSLNHRPCLNSHIERCLAPCAGNISKEEYNKVVLSVLEFLKGNDNSVKEILENKMKISAEKLDFEMALYYRDQLKILDKLIRRQIAALPKDYNMDIFSAADNGMYSAVSVLIVRGGKILGGDNYALTASIENGDIEIEKNGRAVKSNFNTDSVFNQDMKQNMLSQFIIQYYEKTPTLPDEIIVNEELETQDALEKLLFMLYGKKINIVCPHQGVRKQLTDMALNNAYDYLDTFITKMLKRRSMTIGAVEDLKSSLELKKLPERIECYDVSHISGTDKVAGMVVFINGEPAKKMYRRFKIKTVEGNNDFASMYECLSRRLMRLKTSEDESFLTLPDLIVIDGGKGQLKYACKAMADNDVSTEIIALAEREDEVFLPNQKNSVILLKNSPALSLLQRVRDEAHRFAVDYHKKLRTKRMSFSELENIKGIGEVKINNLYNKFKTMAKIKNADIEELTLVKGISKKNAEDIIAYFNNGKN